MFIMSAALTSDLATYISIALGCIAIGFSLWSWWTSNKNQKDIGENISTNTKLITSTTDLLEVSSKIGINAAHENREIALQKIEHLFSEEEKFIVVGSSLKGLKVFVPKLEQILAARSANSLESKFLLTHPCFSRMRERQENRSGGDIVAEIEEMASFLQKCGVKRQNIRFYLGSPTNFLVITSNYMLINPYPYQIEAYKCFCLEVERKKVDNICEQIAKNFPPKKGNNFKKEKGPEYRPSNMYKDLINDDKRLEEFIKELKSDPKYDYSYDIADDIYGQFYWHHYFLPWYSKFTITYDQFENVCNKDERLRDCIENGALGSSDCFNKKGKHSKKEDRSIPV